MKVFLTGATGYIGRPLTRALLERGWHITALVRRPDSPEAHNLAQLGVNCAQGGVTARDSVETAMRGAELVIHNAGHYEYGVDAAGRARMEAVNVAGTDNVLNAARALKVTRTVYVSTATAYGDSGQEPRDETFVRRAPCVSWYERTKTEAHELALRYQGEGLPLVVVCPNGVMGANDHSAWGYTLRLYLNGLKPPVSWSPRSVFSLVELSDLVQGVVLAAEKGRDGEVYLLCGEPASFAEHFELWADVSGGGRVRAYLPPAMMAALVAPLGPLQRRAGLPAFMSRETVKAGAISLFYVSDKAQGELGWRHRSAKEMWQKTIVGELELLARRPKRDLVSRLRPLAVE